MSNFQKHLNDFENSPTVCNYFKYLSAETWFRIYFIRNLARMKIYETTITQNIIFSFMLNKIKYGWNVKLYEAKNEPVEGNDLELIVFHGNRSIVFYIQAKLLYSSNRYAEMSHPHQMESLINHEKNSKNK